MAFPLVSIALLVNGVWWIVMDYLSAFFWATIFHGMQYLAIVSIFRIWRLAQNDGNHAIAGA